MSEPGRGTEPSEDSQDVARRWATVAHALQEAFDVEREWERGFFLGVEGLVGQKILVMVGINKMQWASSHIEILGFLGNIDDVNLVRACGGTGFLRGGLYVDSDEPYPVYFREPCPLRSADPQEVVSAVRMVALAVALYRKEG